MPATLISSKPAYRPYSKKVETGKFARRRGNLANSTLGVAIFAGSQHSSAKSFMGRACAVYPNFVLRQYGGL